MGSKNSRSQRKKEFKWPKFEDVRAKYYISDSEDESELPPPFRVLEPPPTSSIRIAPSEIPWIVEKIAAHMRAEYIVQLHTALQIGHPNTEKIMNMFPGRAEKQAAALMYFWLHSQPHPSAEKLLGALRVVGLNYDWVLVDSDPPLPAGGADGCQQPQVKAPLKMDKATNTKQQDLPKHSSSVARSVAEKQTQTEQLVEATWTPADGYQQPQVKAPLKMNKATNTKQKDLPKHSSSVARSVAEKGMQTEQLVEATWTSAELWAILQKAPDPIMVPMDFQKWLRLTCVLYEPRPAEVERLLKLTYNRKWKDAEVHFQIPGARADADWPSSDAMTAWLDGNCTTSLETVARRDPGYVSPSSCIQKPNESVSDFVFRFQQQWESKETVFHPLAVLTLVQNLQSHIANVFKLKLIGWETYSLHKVRNYLAAMDVQGMFEPQTKVQDLVSQEDSSSDESEPPFYYRPRWGGRRGRCFSCGRHGHWARECRAAPEQHSPYKALEWY